MLRAMQYCHEVVNVVHKDIKPDNIMIGVNREAVLIDFGVSVQQDHTQDNAMLGLKAGTYLYFAPELFKGKKSEFGQATDLWALGLTFYYMLTGRLPYEDAKSVYELRELIA